MSDSSINTGNVTQMLKRWALGKSDGLDELIPLVYDELHKQASRYLRRERQNHTLQTTALINETYLKLVEQRNANWENRTQFFAICAQIMRRILIDYARAKSRDKRGGNDIQVSIQIAEAESSRSTNIDLLALDEALERLEKLDPQQVRIVELRYFSGLSLEETAESMGLSRSTVAREWAVAKAWLRRELTR